LQRIIIKIKKALGVFAGGQNLFLILVLIQPMGR